MWMGGCWSSSDSDDSYMENSESEEAALITKRFVPPFKVDDSPSSESDAIKIDEQPYDLDITNIEIYWRIAYRSYELVK